MTPYQLRILVVFIIICYKNLISKAKKSLKGIEYL